MSILRHSRPGQPTPLRVGVAVGLSFALALAVSAAMPASAALVPFTGTLTLEIGAVPGTVDIQIVTPGGGVATVNQSGGGHPITHLTLPAGAFATSTTVPVPNAFPLVQIAFGFQNGPVVLTGGGCTAGHPNVSCPGGGLAGFGGLSGSALFGFFTTPSHTAGSFVTAVPGFNLVVPLSPVGGGSTVMTQGGGLTVGASGAGWTTGSAKVLNSTGTLMIPYHLSMNVPGFCPPFCASVTFFTTQTGTTLTIAGARNTNPASGFGTDALTLVSPIQLFTNSQGPTGQFIPSFAAIAIHLVPEPGVFILLVTGFASLALYGRRRMRRSR